MPWSGDIGAMGRLAENIGRLASVPSQAAPRVAKAIDGLIQDEFGSASDPYGTPWKEHAPATVERWGAHPILQLTQAMRSETSVQPMQGAGVSITFGVPYVAPHQTGWSGPQGSGPARPILPSRGMPQSWKDAIDGTIDEEFRKVVA